MITATKTKETLKVEKVGEFGVFANNKWYGISQYGDASLEDFTVGGGYDVEVNFSKAGKPYIDSVLSKSAALKGESSPEPVAKAAPAKRSYTKKSYAANGEKKEWKGTTPEERKSSGHSQKVGGVQHDFAATFAALVTTGRDVEEAFALAIELNVRARRELEEKLSD